MGFAVPIVTGAISAFSAWRNAKAAGQQNKLMQQGQQGGLAVGKQAQAAGTGLLQQGMPATQNAINYYATLLRGNRAAMQQATAGSAAQLTDVYRGAQRGLEHQGVRGGERATAQAELNRDRANSIAQLTTGQQSGAAAALADIGGRASGQGVNALGVAGNAYGDVTGSASRQGQYDTNNERSDLAGVGKSVGEILKIWQQRRGPGGGGGPRGGVYSSGGGYLGE